MLYSQGSKNLTKESKFIMNIKFNGNIQDGIHLTD